MTKTITLPTFRISRAALGRRLASTILKSREANLTPEEFMETVNAVFESCVSEDYSPADSENLNAGILKEEQEEIKKSERRSEAARKAAERRRKLREEQSSARITQVEAEEISQSRETADPAPEISGRKKRRRNRRRRRNRSNKMNGSQGQDSPTVME